MRQYLPHWDPQRLVTTRTRAEPTTIEDARKYMDDSFGPNVRVVDATTTSSASPTQSTGLSASASIPANTASTFLAQNLSTPATSAGSPSSATGAATTPPVTQKLPALPPCSGLTPPATATTTPTFMCHYEAVVKAWHDDQCCDREHPAIPKPRPIFKSTLLLISLIKAKRNEPRAYIHSCLVLF